MAREPARDARSQVAQHVEAFVTAAGVVHDLPLAACVLLYLGAVLLILYRA